VRKIAVAVVVMTIFALSDTAATASPKPHAAGPARTAIVNASGRKVFQIRPGKIFDVTATVHGVRRGDRLALESLYRAGPHKPSRWHVLGSWRMHRGERHFVGKTRGTTPGLFTLRVQFLRHHGLLKNSQSNRFYVRVGRFRFKKLAKPHRHASAGSGAFGTVSDPASSRQIVNWQEPIQCAPDGPIDTVGHGILVPPPTADIGILGNVAQVVWVQQAAPGGTFGAWHIAATPVEETLTAPDPNEISIGGGNDTHVSNELGSTLLDYPNDSGDVFRNIAWDLEIQASDGSWVWVSPTAWYTPSSYEQWTQDGQSHFTSNFCETYNS
jgi:hypothetical protein